MNESMIGHEPIKAARPRVATYVYVASMEQGDLSGQMADRQKNLRVAATDLGWDVVAQFSDASCKGKAIRPGFEALLKSASSVDKPFDKVMVADLSALSRKAHIALDRFRALTDAGVEIVAPQGRTQSMTDALHVFITTEYAQMIRAARSRRTKVAGRARRQTNRHPAHGCD